MSRPVYTPEFESLWSIYPKRAGGNPKIKAFKAYTARIKQGYTHQEIKEGLDRYKAYCEGRGIIQTEFVQQASTFFGVNENFLEDWCLPKPEPKQETLEQRAQRLGITAKVGETMEQYKQRVFQARG